MRRFAIALAIALAVALLTVGGAAAVRVEVPAPVAIVVGVVPAAAYLVASTAGPASTKAAEAQEDSDRSDA